MNKFILSALAAGALALGGAVSAQVVGSLPKPTDGSVPWYMTQGQVYVDTHGRQFFYDQYWRQVFLPPGYTYGVIAHDSAGQPVYGAVGPDRNFGVAPLDRRYGDVAPDRRARDRDRDGDGVANRQDRWPDDPRYR